MTAFSKRFRQRPGWSAAFLVLIAVWFTGCEQKADRFDLAGTVTFHGQPIPAGYMVLNPDVAAGNRGPGTTATIADGRYQTLKGRGTIGGPHVVTVFGFDGKEYAMTGGIANPLGKPLCKSDIKADLPKENATYEIAVTTKSR